MYEFNAKTFYQSQVACRYFGVSSALLFPAFRVYTLFFF